MPRPSKKPVATQPPDDTYAEYNGPVGSFKRGLPTHSLNCFWHGAYEGMHKSSDCPTCEREEADEPESAGVGQAP